MHSCAVGVYTGNERVGKDNIIVFSDYTTVMKQTRMRALCVVFFFSSRRRHTRFDCDWSSDVCSSDLYDANSTSATHVRPGAIDNGCRADAPATNPRSSRASALDASGESFAIWASGRDRKSVV